MTSPRIRVVMHDSRVPTWELMINDAIAYRFESFVEYVDFITQGTSAARYQPHEFKPAKR